MILWLIHTDIARLTSFSRFSFARNNPFYILGWLASSGM
jgi:hypothetical protein